MKESKVLRRWREKKTAVCALLNLADPMLTEMVSQLPFVDCVWFDLEHGPMSVETAYDLMRTVRLAGCDVLARPGKGEFMRMGRMLEAGASGIMYPRCESVEDACEFVRWAKFPSLGERGFTGINADAHYRMADMGEYLETANRETFLCPMIESPTALKCARAIAEVEGIDMLFFGPGDYASLSGLRKPLDHSLVVAACEEACKAALAAGKRFGSLAFTEEHARKLLDMGATFLVCYSDTHALQTSFLKFQKELVSLRLFRHAE